MPRELLKAGQIDKLISVKGKHADGAGLYLQVARPGQASWTFQFRWQSQTKWMSIGPQSIYPLALAREKHAELRRMVHEGKDPRGETGKALGASFGDVLTEYLRELAPSWKGGAAGKQAISYEHSFDRLPALKAMSA